MGVLSNILDISGRGLRGALTCCSTSVVLLVSATAFADSNAVATTPAPPSETILEASPEPTEKRPVSMSPTALEQPAPNPGDASLVSNEAAEPLTRAAAKLRVDAMSPTEWLSRFGNVSIGQLQ